MAEFYGTDTPDDRAGELDQLLELLRIRGFAALPGVLSPEEVRDYCDRLDAVYGRQATDFGEERLAAIGESNVARCPLAYDETFLELVEKEPVKRAVGAILGDYYVLHLQNGIIVHPNLVHHQSAWHRDLPYQEYVSSRPLAVNAFYCLEDFTPETGGTRFLPFSHRVETLPSKRVLETLEEQPKTPAGSVVFFDSMVFHRAGHNVSKVIRRAINHVFTVGILRQQIDIPGWLPEQNPELHARVSDDPALRVILGYEARTAESVPSYRERRFDKVSQS